MQASKIQVNLGIYVKNFIGDPDKMVECCFSGSTGCVKDFIGCPAEMAKGYFSGVAPVMILIF